LNLPCRFIANECNWRLKEGGSGINKLIYEAAGPHLKRETKLRYRFPAIPGGVYPVPLSQGSPLLDKQGVSVVFHCLGPNFNPLQPNCINDYQIGEDLLKKCYETLFDYFYQLIT